ncbi:zinc finger protein 678-like isoform X2 [Palaemon carinicauda]|uniref:zinc finger protein 678-like isoform X2 n=1 Tax=Palaemon carinicauda TaxID=392227 RepID=UPI0035B5A65E
MDVVEVDREVNIDDILQSVPWTQIPPKKKIHLYVVRKNAINEQSVESLVRASTTRKIPLYRREEPNLNAVSGCVNETRFSSPGEITLDSGRKSYPLIDLEADDVSENMSDAEGDVDNCIMLDKGTQTIGNEDYQGTDVQVGFEANVVEVPVNPQVGFEANVVEVPVNPQVGFEANVVEVPVNPQVGFEANVVEVPVNPQVGFEANVVEVPVNPQAGFEANVVEVPVNPQAGFEANVVEVPVNPQVGFEANVVEVPVNPECLLISKKDKPDFVHKKIIETDKTEKHGSEVCRMEEKLLSSNDCLSEISKLCPLCFKVVPSEVNLHKHLLWHLLIKNTNESCLASPLADGEFNFDGLIVENKSFEELLSECKQYLKSKEGLYCKLCFKNFEFHYDIAQLIDLVDFSVPPKCVKCHEIYKDMASLEIHLRQHLRGKPFGCCICSKVFQDVSEVKLHMSSHLFHTYGKFFQCRYCSKLSFTEKENSLHQSCHINASNFWKFSSKLECQDITKGQGANFSKSEKTVNDFFRPASSALYDFTRNLPGCENAFEVVEEISKFTKMETSSCHEKVLIEGELRALTSVINLSKELGELLDEDQNTSQRSDSPDDSGQLMAYNQVLISSYGSILSDLYKHKCWCNFCGQSFLYIEDLYSHRNVCYNASRIFPCEDCNAEFDSMNLLFEHRNTHRVLHVRKCPICDTHFNFKFDITQHLKVHFADTLRRCPECGLPFKFHHELVRHLQTHIELTPYLDECKQCNAFFAGKDQLDKHNVRMHLVDRPYECSVCGKRFFRQNVWLLHSKGHIRNKFRKSLRGMDLYKPCKWSKTKLLKS